MEDAGVVEVEMEKIVFPTMWRRFLDREKVDLLKKDIAAHGLINPIIVQELKNGQYRLVAGYRRFTACRELEMKTVPAKVVRNATEEEILSLVVRENEIRENFSPVDVAKIIWDLKDMGESLEEIASILSVTPQQTQDYLTIHEKVCEEAKDIVARSPMIDFSTALLLAKVEDKRMQVSHAQMIAEGGSQRLLREYVAEEEASKIARPQVQEVQPQVQPQMPQPSQAPQGQPAQEARSPSEVQPAPEVEGKPGFWVDDGLRGKFFVPEELGHVTPFKRPTIVPPELNSVEALRNEIARLQSFPRIDKEAQAALLSKIIQLQAEASKKAEEKTEPAQGKIETPVEEHAVEGEKLEIAFKFYNREKYDTVKKFFMKPDGSMDSNLLYDIVEEKLAEQA